MFKRRKTQGLWERMTEQAWPRGGIWRALKYQWHRFRRLPDPPHRIARGVFAGTFVNFPPIIGLQLVAAALFAWALRGNILAALAATLLSNPVTTPLIALVSLHLGHWILGTADHFTVEAVFNAFTAAGGEIWHNVLALFGPEVAHWDVLAQFWRDIYLPYLVGSILPGLLISALFAWASIPITDAAQRLRRRRLAARAASKAAKGDESGPPKA